MLSSTYSVGICHRWYRHILRLMEVERGQLLARYIREARERKGLTPPQLAQKVGVFRGTVNDWEKGESVPNLLMLGPLCDALGVTADLFRRLPSAPRSPLEDYLEEVEEAQSRARQRVRERRPPTP